MQAGGEQKMPTNVGSLTLDGADTAHSEEEVRNRLEYLADILLDLQSFTGSSGGAVLNGLLALAHTEARLQAQRLPDNADEAV